MSSSTHVNRVEARRQSEVSASLDIGRLGQMVFIPNKENVMKKSNKARKVRVLPRRTTVSTKLKLVMPPAVLQAPEEASQQGLLAGIKKVARANFITAQALWDAQPWAMIARLAVVIASVAAPTLTWWSSGKIVDGLTNRGDGSSLSLEVAVFIGSLVLLGLIPIALGSLERLSDNHIFLTVFAKLTRKVVSFTQEHLADARLSELIRQVRERAVWRMMTMARSQPGIARNVGMLLVTGCLLAVQAPALIPLLATFSLPSMVLEVRHARRRCDLDEELAPVWGGLWGNLGNILAPSALMMLQNFGAAFWFAERYRKGVDAASKQECKLEEGAALKRLGCASLVGLGLLGSAWVLVARARAGSISAGDVVLAFGAMTSFAGCLAEFASSIGQQWSQSESIHQLMELLSHRDTEEVTLRSVPIEQEYRHGAAPLQAGAQVGSELVFNNVSLQYPGTAEGQYAVRGVSFRVKQGSVVAVVGPNGAGKSSTMSLLLRQMSPTGGQISIDGKPIGEMTAEEFSREVIMLPQKLEHFNLSVRDLLNLGRPHDAASDEVIWQELDRLGAAEFVRKWHKGLDTKFGHQREGIEPSGGQLQRLLLVAAVLAKRGLIVMDEPVSAVDPEAAKRFWDGLFRERTDRTVIFSTHHLGAVRRADTILFIEDGRLAAQGTHDDLMLSSEKYKRLFDAQADDYR
jgi:ATP-binding cassette subfamily B protein